MNSSPNFTKISFEDIKDLRIDPSQDIAEIISDESNKLCKTGLDPNKDEELKTKMNSIFKEVQDHNNWKSKTAVVTESPEDAKLILSSLRWHHAAGDVIILKEDKYLVFSKGYSAQ